MNHKGARGAKKHRGDNIPASRYPGSAILPYLCRMNQIKHILFASLVLICVVLCVMLVHFLSSAKPAPRARISYDGFPGPGRDSIPAYILRGGKLFTQNCQSCHALKRDIAAPGLHGVTKRGPWGNRKNLYRWVRNPASFVADTQDPYLKRLLAGYGYMMQAFPELTDEEIDAIIEYIEYVSPNMEEPPIAARQ